MAKIFDTAKRARAYADKMNKKARVFKYIVMDYMSHKDTMVIKRRKR